MIANLIPNVEKHAAAVAIICAAFILQKIMGMVVNRNKFDQRIILLLHKLIKTVVWVIAFVVILPLYGINISALIATLGVGSLAIALAAQDTIANIISGFLIMVDAPFRIGDRIKIPSGEVVQVLDVGVRRSKFLSEDKKTVIIVPNLELSKSKIINYTYAQEMN